MRNITKAAIIIPTCFMLGGFGAILIRRIKEQREDARREAAWHRFIKTDSVGNSKFRVSTNAILMGDSKSTSDRFEFERRNWTMEQREADWLRRATNWTGEDVWEVVPCTPEQWRAFTNSLGPTQSEFQTNNPRLRRKL